MDKNKSAEGHKKRSSQRGWLGAADGGREREREGGTKREKD